MARELNNRMNQYTLIPVTEIIKPKNNTICITDHWWEIRADCVIGFKMFPTAKGNMSPRCNSDEQMIKRLIHADSSVMFLPVASWPQQ